MATIEFAPPRHLTASQGGVVLTERVLRDHKVAWIIQAAAEGAVDLRQASGRHRVLELVRTGPDSPHTAPILDTMFQGRNLIVLGAGHDPGFAAGWDAIDVALRHWKDDSGFWDSRGHLHSWSAGRRGALGVVLGVVAAAVGWFGAGRWDGIQLPLAVALGTVGALAVGAGIAALRARWELEVRTPAGSAAWLRVESFRRFLAASEAWHVEEAARRGLLREYTAWAVAVGEVDRWTEAVTRSTVGPTDAEVRYPFLVPALVYSTGTSVTPPSSYGVGGLSGLSGSSSGGGGSVGGGAGGGSVGSW